MKKETLLHNLVLSFIMIVVLTFSSSCSNDDFFSMDYDNPNQSFATYISLGNIKSGSLTAFQKEQFKEAAHRFSCRLVFEKDNTISLIEGTTAQDLKISNNLFELFNEVIDLWNEKPTTLIIKKANIPMTKGGDPESTTTRGGNVFCDIAANTIYNIIVSNGWTLTAKLFHMWYFDNRCSTYTLTYQEWTPIATYSNNNVGTNYQNNSFTYEGYTYYQKSLSFYNASNDLRFALGTSTISIDYNGYAVGLSDFYDFNAGDRSFINETLVSIIRNIGDEGGFPIKYGIVKP